jgi:Tol biopolymer transport system component
MDADGRHIVQLVGGDANWPVISRDDKRVLFTSARNGVQSLWSVPMEGGQPTEVLPVRVVEPDISRDGKSVVFGGVDETGQVVLTICEFPSCKSRRQFQAPSPLARWTPDGNAVAFVDRGNPTNVTAQPLNGTSRYQITHFTDGKAIGSFAWSPDGQRLAIARSTTTNDIVLFKGLRGRSQ